ncbi:hypothetical protein NDU88_007082 [Pleurodeles waltl]|uniref:EF-hand domain-containing protein n=1 Tax=Pleurodeles waltl TaxID=8319 RepID=A0AAV7N1A4_PLEWA|nr:hypothetical protein NDU88_007082 [Pleurodeles waltl]
MNRSQGTHAHSLTRKTHKTSRGEVRILVHHQQFTMKSILLFVILSLALVSDASPVPILEDQEMGYALQEPTVNPDDSLQFQIVELPSEFNIYDMNKDGSITLNELSDITQTESDDATLPFHNADKDGNDMLTKQEFEEAPWVFNIPDRVKI